ncbi:MAG: hypothetical protein VB980_00360 [Opitutales bacterium]
MNKGIGSVSGLFLGNTRKKRGMKVSMTRCFITHKKGANPIRPQSTTRFTKIRGTYRWQLTMRFSFVASHAIHFVNQGMTIGEPLDLTKIGAREMDYG